jgi:hypothetical protein
VSVAISTAKNARVDWTVERWLMLKITLRAAIFTLLIIASGVQAAVPETISYQGFVRDDAGVPLDGTFEITFSLYNDHGLGELELPVWTVRKPIDFDQGVFQTNLGEVVGFGASLFLSPLFLGITIHPEGEGPTGPQSPELTPRQPLSSVPYAFEADNAQLLAGFSPASLDQSSHVADTENPHSVTAAQVQAIDQTALDAALLGKSDVDHNHDDRYYRKAEVDTFVQNLVSANAALAVRVAALEALGVEAQIQNLQTQITALQNAGGGGSSAIDPFVRVDGTDIFIEGANLHVTNGSGTQTTSNALGNLIVGYNPGNTVATGSHNLVLGTRNKYSATGGIISGQSNSISARDALALGGDSHVVSGIRSAAIGGSLQQVQGPGSVAIGGFFGKSTGKNSATVGGRGSRAEGVESVAIGGFDNIAQGPYSVILGGLSNRINSGADPINPDPSNLEAAYSTIIGGQNNATNALFSLIAGGDGNNIGTGDNLRKGNTATIVGGKGNSSSGDRSLIAGGLDNTVISSSLSTEVGRGAALIGGVSNSVGFGPRGASSNVAIVGGSNNEGSEINVLVLGGAGQSGNSENSVTQPATQNIDDLEALFAGVTRNGDDLVFSGLNLQLVNGSGETITSNGLGNLVLGYNETIPSGITRSGSHNVVVGPEHGYSGNAGIVQGKSNVIGLDFSAVLSSEFSQATKSLSVIVGASNSSASGRNSSVFGGHGNVANKDETTIVGGRNVTTSD